MEQNSKPSPFKSPLVEILIVLVLAFLIVISLNYFGIISLSLPFLPSKSSTTTTQTRSTTQSQKAFTAKQIVSPLNPLVINNTDQQTLVKPLDNGMMDSDTGQIRVDVELGLTSNLTVASGLVFSPTDDTTKKILLSYDPVGKLWKIGYYHGKDLVKETVIFRYTDSSLIYGKFTVLIGANGKTVRTSFLPLSRLVNIALPESFWGTKKQVTTNLQVAPGSRLQIQNFTYETFE